MLEDHLKLVRTRERLRSGAAAEYVDGYADWLYECGYAPISIVQTFQFLARWTDWMREEGFGTESLLAGFDAYKETSSGPDNGRRRYKTHSQGVASAALFIKYLQQCGVLPAPNPTPTTTPDTICPLLREFRYWMRQHRGLKDSSLDLYQGVLIDLVAAVGDDPGEYTIQAMRDFIMMRAQHTSMWRAKTFTAAVRAFLRFLGATGRCPAGMDHGIPGFAFWRLSTVPKFVELEDVARIIEACRSRRDVVSTRDRAVVLLLARLGLRAIDIAQLALDQIDWKEGRIAVCGKGRREEWLPLPQEVGDAILLYIQQRRRASHLPQLFTTTSAPFRPLNSNAVSRIVRRAIRRAGIKSKGSGAHVLRHSAATAMLRQGASLAGVGAVLRHRSPNTTLLYAKVDFALLSTVAQPWPEV